MGGKTERVLDFGFVAVGRAPTRLASIPSGSLHASTPEATLSFDVDRLARALFDVDPEVRRIVHEKSDFVCVTRRHLAERLRHEGQPDTVSVSVEDVSLARLERAFEVAWQIDEGGLRTKWTEIAQAAVERLECGR